MNRVVAQILFCVVMGVGTCGIRAAHAVDSSDLQARQQAQVKARVLARELVSGVLNTQIRQLRENGLDRLPIYGEIRQMRKNIDGLVEEEMDEVVELLVKAQMAEKQNEKVEHFNQARTKIREVVLSLMAERQKLLKRLQVARIAAQVRELIGLETAARSSTISLHEVAAVRREQTTLELIEDQRDIEALFFALVKSLDDARTWSGAVGAAAADGLRILQAAQVTTHLQGARTNLTTGVFEVAASHQASVILGLQALLEKIEETRGLISADREAAMKMVREMIRRQEELRGETNLPDATEQQVCEQIRAQQEIHRDLGRLAETLETFPSTQSLLDQAKASAYQARDDIFKRQVPEAVKEQTKVIGSLAEIEEQLKHAIDLERSDKSAEELAGEIKDLEQLKNELEQAANKQHEVVDAAKDKPAEAKAAQEDVVQQLDRADEKKELPGTIESRLADAQQAAEEAAQSLEKPNDQNADDRQSAVEKAADAIQRALAETGAQLADTKRRQLAVEVGELARAAEALERAAAAEKEIARAADEAARAEGLKAEEANQLATKQEDVNKVAEKIAEGVKYAAPEIAAELTKAKKPLDDAANNLAQAKDQPGEASKPYASEVARAATEAAKTLEQAAAELREQQGKTAEQLADLAGEQLEKVTDARQAVDSALHDQAKTAADDPLENLQQALGKVQEAQALQKQAEGKVEAAKAQEFANQVRQLAKQQSRADAEAESLAKGKANTPLDAVNEQQKTAEQAADLAEQAEGQIAEQLNKASQAAAEAAKELLTGTPSKADAARQEAAQALSEAQQAADQAAADADKNAPGEPDAAAQSKVGENAAAAEQLAKEGSPAASEALGKAKQQSTAAERHIQGGDKQAAIEAQRSTAQALDEAAVVLKEAIASTAQEVSQSLAEQAETTGQLASKAANVDPAAASALQQGKQAAQQGAQQASSDPDQATQAQADVGRALERAAASLSAREQQIRSDRDIAQAVGQLAKDQQAARDEIVRQADVLNQLSDGSEGTPSDPAQVAAAQALETAAHEFAEAQRATGEGAAAISGQREVANHPIREGLDAASQLTEPADPAAGQLADTPPAEDSSPAGEVQGEGLDGHQGPKGQGLGNGLVPNSPDVTAQQIAGPAALARASQALAQSPRQGQGSTKQPIAGASSPVATTGGGASVVGVAVNNQEAPDKALQLQPTAQADSRATGGNEDSAAISREFEREPWFAKLPPDLQKAIKARARVEAPRGYEERLRRYFESID